jgi:hypothetical protein
MKFFAFIMAILVIVLSCIPCKDFPFAMKAGKGKMELSKSSGGHSMDHPDACSPFCQCACCAGFPINHQFAEVKPLLPVYNEQYIAVYHASVVSISLPVWEPPQLA